MSELAPGVFTWFDYVTPEIAKAQAFHQALFGWSSQTLALVDGAYPLIVVEGRVIGGYRGPIVGTPPNSPKDTPPNAYWLAHLRVTDAHAAAAKAKAVGGKMLREPFSVGDFGKLAIVLDPVSAVVGLAQPTTATDWSQVPNTFCWNELYTTGTTTAVTFYKQLGGFTEAKSPTPDGGHYHSLERDGAARAGIRKPHPNMPSGWFAWVQVASADHTAATAHALGATIHQPPADVGPSRMTLFTDPSGAAVGVISPR